MRGIHLDNFYELLIRLVRCCALGVTITTSRIHVEVGHCLFYTSVGCFSAETSIIPSLHAIFWFILLAFILCDLGFLCPLRFI